MSAAATSFDELDERLAAGARAGRRPHRPPREPASVTVSRPASSSGHACRPTPAPCKAPRPPRRTRSLCHGHAARRAASTDVVGLEDRRQPRRLEHPGGPRRATAASRRLPPRRWEVVCPRTSARMPALSIDVTPARSTITWRWPRAEELLDVLLERLGGATGDERLLGREDEAVGGGSCSGAHGVMGLRELYTEAAHRRL